jgi:flagellar FliL protein
MAEGTEAAAAAPKKSNKMLMIIIIVVAVLATGGGAYFMLKPTDDKAKAAEAEAAEPGAVIALDPITINLADGHYLKMSFALQAVAEVAEEPDGNKALDIAISQYTGADVAVLSTPKGRDAAKKELTEKIKKAYVKEDAETVMDLYFTSFVTQ